MVTKNNFSKWTNWKDREIIKGMEYPGIYCIAISENNLSNFEFDWIKEINYIGMTNSKTGLKGRLKQFDNTIRGKSGHGGADRFRYEYRDYNDLINNLFVSVNHFKCNVKSILTEDLLVMGEVAKQEYECWAEYVEKFQNLPKFNNKTTNKYSLTVGRENQ